MLPEIVIPPPPESDVTPAFESSTVPPSATVPPPSRPAPALTVIDEFTSFVLSNAPGASCAVPTAPLAIWDSFSGCHELFPINCTAPPAPCEPAGPSPAANPITLCPAFGTIAQPPAPTPETRTMSPALAAAGSVIVTAAASVAR